MSFEKLKEQWGGRWDAIDKARAVADHHFERLKELLAREAQTEGSFDSGDVDLVVFGSLARSEWTSGSDLDRTLLIDGGANHEHANTAHRVTKFLEEAKFKRPGRTGTFGNLTFSHNIIHQIGGSDDSNLNDLPPLVDPDRMLVVRPRSIRAPGLTAAAAA